jgi:hypothetical protein
VDGPTDRRDPDVTAFSRWWVPRSAAVMGGRHCRARRTKVVRMGEAAFNGVEFIGVATAASGPS